MNIRWLKQSSEQRLIIFYNGWGHDQAVVDHLATLDSVLMVNDYRTLEGEWPNLDQFTSIRLIAWSMGVWAAANTLPSLNIDKRIALCGSELPISEEYGIAPKIYSLTLNGVRRKGCHRFAERMFASTDERAFFGPCTTHRPEAEQIEELEQIERLSQENRRTMQWDCAVVASEDQIFPPRALRDYWSGRTRVAGLKSGHCPFAQFRSWDELLSL